MEEKAKWNVNPPFILGITFSFIGAIYLLVGIGLLGAADDVDALTVGSVFAPLGSVFFVAGAAFLIWCLRQKKTADRLLEEGHYVWGKILRIEVKRNISAFGRHPAVAIVFYQDGAGRQHLFRSRYVYRGLELSAAGKPVRIYLGNDTYKQYYVDMEPLLQGALKQRF